MTESYHNESSDSPHYVYSLAYPESMGSRVFYVGKGIGRRIHDHEWQAHNPQYKGHKVSIIRKIEQADERIVKTKLACFATHEEACLYEIALIFFMDGLANKTTGGDGTMGLIPTETARKNMSKAGKGRPKSIEHRRKISEAKKGQPKPWPKGKPLFTPEQQCKINEHNTGSRRTPEARARMREAQKRIAAFHPCTPETRLKRSLAQKGKPKSAETRRKMSEARLNWHKRHLHQSSP